MSAIRFNVAQLLRQERLGIVATTFAEFAAKYVAARGAGISAVYAGTLVRRAAALQEFTRKTKIGDVLTEAHLSAFVRQLAEAGEHAPHTIKSYRSDLITLWRAAADDDLAPYPQSRRIVGLRLPELVVDCYTLDEVEALVAAASYFRGVYDTGALRVDYWAAIVRFAFETGLRRGDCWEFDKGLLRSNGSFRIVQHKTRGVVQRRLRESTIAAIERLRLKKPFAWLHNGWTFGTHFQLLVDVSGVKRGSFKWLRRAAGSYAEAEQPGTGSRALGHSDPTMFRKHYDAQLPSANIPLPPALDAAPKVRAGAGPRHDAKPKLPTAGRRTIAPRVVRIRRRKGGAA